MGDDDILRSRPKFVLTAQTAGGQGKKRLTGEPPPDDQEGDEHQQREANVLIAWDHRHTVQGLVSNRGEFNQHVTAICCKNDRRFKSLYASSLPKECQNESRQCEQERKIPGHHIEVETNSGNDSCNADRHERIEDIAAYDVAD
jgi:hypothetical protein